MKSVSRIFLIQFFLLLMAQSHLAAHTPEKNPFHVPAQMNGYGDDGTVNKDRTSALAFVPSCNNTTHNKAFAITNENREEEEDEAELNSVRKHVKTLHDFTVFVARQFSSAHCFFNKHNTTSHPSVSYSSSYRCILFGVIRI